MRLAPEGLHLRAADQRLVRIEHLSRSTSSARPVADGPKPVSRSPKSEGKRDAIVRAAIEVINSKSYALATMTEIAGALDLRDAALYYYFPNKRALAYACHRHSLGRFERLLRDADKAGGSGAEKLKRFLRHMMADSSSNGPLLYFGDYSYLDAGQRRAVAAWAGRLSSIVEKFLEDGMADGSVVQCEPKLVAQLLLGMLIWLAKWVPDIEDMTVERLMSAIDAFSFHGLESRASTAKKKRP